MHLGDPHQTDITIGWGERSLDNLEVSIGEVGRSGDRADRTSYLIIRILARKTFHFQQKSDDVRYYCPFFEQRQPAGFAAVERRREIEGIESLACRKGRAPFWLVIEAGGVNKVEAGRVNKAERIVSRVGVGLDPISWTLSERRVRCPR